ncbi:uncharacterized protein LOC127101903 [Lathyrus oleraceus]|uniref:uncharacterized protein LOC127101903 n=1 Tax=Pisum sativum TaxID=3888 RepID=UPI0021CEA491|nr:uncharacterized protein LOC127101903 [Pisum sativum]
MGIWIFKEIRGITPAESRLQLSKDTYKDNVDPTQYKRLIESLRYHCHTRLDIAYDVVSKALLLNEYDLHGWKTKVCAKRKNIPGMKKYRGRNTYALESMRPSPVYRRPGYGLTTIPVILILYAAISIY